MWVTTRSTITMSATSAYHVISFTFVVWGLHPHISSGSTSRDVDQNGQHDDDKRGECLTEKAVAVTPFALRLLFWDGVRGGSVRKH